MTNKEQLHFLLGYLEGLKTRSTIKPTDLGVVMDAIDNNSLFHDVIKDLEEEDGDHGYVHEDYDDYSHRPAFGKYKGSYDSINDVLGDLDNYWEID